MKMIKKVLYKQIITRVTQYDYNRLRRIAKEYHYKSYYELLQQLIYCFLRVADPKEDNVMIPLPEEIRNMFPLEAIKRILRSLPEQKDFQEHKAEYEEHKGDIDGMFDDNSNIHSPVYQQPAKSRKSNSQVKYEKEDKI